MSKKSEQQERVPFYKRALSSAGSALFTKSIVNPFDVVKTYIQAEYTIPCRRAVIDTRAAEMSDIPKFFRRTFAATSLIWRDGGIKSMWSGLTPALLIAVPNSIIYYSSYDEFKARLQPYVGNSKIAHFLLPAFCGAMSRGLAVVVVEPLEFVKTQVQAKLPGGLKGSIIRVGKEAGIHGVQYLWKGVYTNLLRDLSFAGLHWMIYIYYYYINYYIIFIIIIIIILLLY
ncbi:hypothetical protein WA158_003967 [Blastocystis sp. Blastoise]